MSAADGVADVVILREDVKSAVPDLLDRIRHAIGTVHLDFTRGLVDRKLVILQVELAIGESETLDDAELRGFFEVEVAGVVPAADVHPGNVVAALVLAVGGCVLIPAIELLSDNGRHAAIVQVRSAMPHAVAFANGDVIQ